MYNKELEVLIWKNNFPTSVKLLNISANAVKKRAKKKGCIMPPPYFHSKSNEYKLLYIKDNMPQVMDNTHSYEV